MDKSQGSGRVRINGGALRGRWVSFSASDVRPTKATVRKTVFNWLRPVISNMVCLDCFCGSGILGFEALSEGAGSVLCLDRSAQVVKDVGRSAIELGVDSLSVCQWGFPRRLTVSVLCDLVFFDPPFGQVGVKELLGWLVLQRCLRVGGLVYIEYNKKELLDPGPFFTVYRQSVSAGVAFCLLLYMGNAEGGDGG
ncbi:MAG: RsmD family RNA methyltransferase [Pseudomonadota bacterium]|nr:RsmD family RNA methyltransferase [Pseudomonadota bacterium]